MFPTVSLTVLAFSAVAYAQRFANVLQDVETSFDLAQIPQTLNINFSPEALLSLSYTDENLDVSNGQLLPVPATQTAPTFSIGFADGTSEPANTFVLVGVDPDAPANITQVRHYLAAGLTFGALTNPSSGVLTSTSVVTTDSVVATTTSTSETTSLLVTLRKRHWGNHDDDDSSSRTRTRTRTGTGGGNAVTTASGSTTDDDFTATLTSSGPGPTSTSTDDNDISFFTLSNSSAAISEYLPPAPSVGSNAHRYIWLLYVQPQNFTAPSGDFLTSRFGFDVSAYAASVGLGDPIAGTFFLAADYGLDDTTTTTTTESATSTDSATSTEVVTSTSTDSVSATITSTATATSTVA